MDIFCGENQIVNPKMKTKLHPGPGFRVPETVVFLAYLLAPAKPEPIIRSVDDKRAKNQADEPEEDCGFH